MTQPRQHIPRRAIILVALLASAGLGAVGCGQDIALPNSPAQIPAAGTIAAPVEGCNLATPDEQPADAGDAGSTDAGSSDAGSTDAGSSDAGTSTPAPEAVLERVDDALSIPYLIKDREADDQQISVEICLWDGQQATDCGVAVAGQGGDSTDFVPTTPAGTCVLHVFRWNVGCGRFVGANDDGANPQRASIDNVDQALVARVSVVGSDDAPTQTEPFTLKDVGFDAVPTCD